MFRFPRRLKIFLAIVLLILGGYFFERWWSSTTYVPKEFSEARMQGALIAQNIVELSNQSAQGLEKINQLDKERNFKEALDITTETIEQSQEIRNQAVELSNQVSKMVQALSGIRSFEARQAALEAIASRLALISRLINYSDYLNQLLNVLRLRFAGQPGDHQTATIINQINAEVTAINNFNNQATQAMEKFDQLTQTR